MQRQYEEQYHKVEVDHWWFVERRHVMRQLLRGSIPNPHTRILEVGCSAGFFLQQLKMDGYDNALGIDTSADAIDRCRDAGVQAQLMDAQSLAFPDASADAIVASDVLEHLPDERRALAEWGRVLKPDGWLMVFVPAFMFLWTDHDVANKHCRRYKRQELLQLLKDSGFTIERSSYWNTFLFPPIAVVRCVKRLLRGGRLPENGSTGDLFVPAKFFNRALQGLLRLENTLFLHGLNWPIGVSLMVLARKPAA